MKEVLRWVAVPFVAVIAMVIAHAVIHILSGINSAGYEFYYGVETTSVVKIGCALLRDFCAGAAFVYAGAMTAPSHNKTTSIVLATIIGVISVISLIIVLTSEFRFLQCLGIIATVVGTIYACQLIEEEQKKNNQ